ncbi:MAG: DNA polymerase III subunit alpha [Pseudomonadota bacterium]
MNQFIHLHVHSAYSLAEGAIRTKELVKACKEQGMPAVGVTDTNNLFGALEFAMAARDAGFQPIIGCQLQIDTDGKQIVLLVQNQQGYLNLSKLVSDAYMQTEHSPQSSLDELEDLTEGLICLSGGPLQGVTEEADILKLKELFGDRFYIELQRHGLPQEDQVDGTLIDLAYAQDIPLVATNDAYFMDQGMHEAHDALLCIAEGRYVNEGDRRKVTSEHYLKSSKEMMSLFKDVPEAIDNTSIISQRCSFLLKPIDPILPPFEGEHGNNEIEELRAQSKEGLQWRIDNYVDKDADHQPYWDRLEFELDVIEGMGFPGYFLIVSDFIKWAKDHDIPVGPGRGSGAGSVVAWALKITDLDPLEYNLLFERFLNPERVSMPDFDVDFCQDRRDEVIEYVQDKYGRDKVAQIITFGKLQARAVVRDVGRVLQIPYPVVDRLAKMIPNNPANPITLGEALEQDADLRAERDKDDTNKKLIDIALKLEGLFRHASTHAAGVVIADRPLHELVPVYRDPRSDMPVTQFNMKYVEQAGLVKFDFLGLKTLTVVQKAVQFIQQTTGEEIDVLKLPMEDEKSFELLSKGAATGVFQLESTGMRDVLRKMKPNRLEDIIALVSLYRPGPMDNIPKYISTKEGKDEPDYLHPKLQPILEETFGIMIYQEQVMQAAQILSGYSLGGADLLRRAMGKKIKEAMDAEREKFVKGAKEHNDVGADQAGMVFDQIAKFAGYGFNKSHAAAYALIAYQTAYLKANYPVEFMAALMTLDMGNTDKLSAFKQDLDKLGIKLLPPDINSSDVAFKVEDGAIRYALAALKGVGEGAMEKLVEERNANGAFIDLSDFVERIDTKMMNKRQFEGLVCAGAFDSVFPDRAELHGGIETLLKHASSKADERESGQESLFGDDAVVNELPPLPQTDSWDPLEKLGYEFGAVGFYLSAHPLDSRADQFARMNVKMMANVEADLQDKPTTRVQMAGVLIKKQERVSAKSGNKFAFLQLSDSTGVYEVMIFSDTLARAREFLEPGTSLLVTVDAESKEDQVRYTGQRIEPLEEAMANKLQEVVVEMDASAPAAKLKEFLDIEGEGRVKILMMLLLSNGRRAEIHVPGYWSLSPQAINQIRKTPGVLDIRER